MTERFAEQRGVALMLVLLVMLLLGAIGAGVGLVTSLDTQVAANFRAASEALYAADAMLAWAALDVRRVRDWNTLLAGAARSAFVDGPPGRRVVGGSVIDLVGVTNEANCRRSATCTLAELNARTNERPWGPNNPRWTLYAHGRLSDLDSSVALGTTLYVAAWVADDPSETDDDPLKDGTGSSVDGNHGRGILALRAEAFGLRGTRRVVEATIARYGTDASEDPAAFLKVRRLSWREVR